VIRGRPEPDIGDGCPENRKRKVKNQDDRNEKGFDF
jgi:hypothetical protein